MCSSVSFGVSLLMVLTGCATLMSPVEPGPGTSSAEATFTTSTEIVFAKAMEAVESLGLTAEPNVSSYEIHTSRLFGGGGFGERVRIKVERIDIASAKMVVLSRPVFEGDSKAKDWSRLILERSRELLKTFEEVQVIIRSRSEFGRAKVSYEQAKFTDARSILSGLEPVLTRLTSSSDRDSVLAQVLLYRGLVEVALGREVEASVKFVEALRLAPTLHLDANDHSPKIVDLFSRAKSLAK